MERGLDFSNFADNSGNWNTAYGWGDHGAAGYGDATEDYVNEQIGNLSIPTNNNELTNGAGYITGISFANVSSKPTFSVNSMLSSRATTAIDTVGDSNGVTFNYSASNAVNKPSGTDHSLMTMAYSTAWQTQLAQDWRNKGRMYLRGQENGTWSSWVRVHSTDDFSTTDVANGVTAYGWGDHGDGGYITGVSWPDIGGDAAEINVSGFNNDAGYSTLAIGTTSTTAMAGNTLSTQDLTDIGNLSGTNTGDQSISSIKTGIGTGNGKLVPSAGTAGHFLKHDGTFGLPSYTTNTDTQLSQEEVIGMLTAGTNVTISAEGVIASTDTDTVYTHPTSAGNKHIPSGGAAGQFLRYSASGTATWATPSYTTNTNTTYSAGGGLDLTGTTFSVEPDLRDGITHVGKDSNNYIQFDSTNEAYRFLCRWCICGSDGVGW